MKILDGLNPVALIVWFVIEFHYHLKTLPYVALNPALEMWGLD